MVSAEARLGWAGWGGSKAVLWGGQAGTWTPGNGLWAGVEWFLQCMPKHLLSMQGSTSPPSPQLERHQQDERKRKPAKSASLVFAMQCGLKTVTFRQPAGETHCCTVSPTLLPEWLVVKEMWSCSVGAYGFHKGNVFFFFVAWEREAKDVVGRKGFAGRRRRAGRGCGNTPSAKVWIGSKPARRCQAPAGMPHEFQLCHNPAAIPNPWHHAGKPHRGVPILRGGDIVPAPVLFSGKLVDDGHQRLRSLDWDWGL